MGYAIVYCAKCSSQLRDPDFQKGSAIRIGDNSYCAACAPEGATLWVPPPSPAPQRPAGSKTTRSIPVVEPPKTARRTVAAGRSRLLGAAAFGGILGAVLLVALGYSPTPPRPAPLDLKAAGRSIPPTEGVPAVSRTPSPPAEPRRVDRRQERESLARQSLAQARALVLNRPDDFQAQALRYDQAVRDATDTPLFEEAARERNQVEARRLERLQADLSALDSAIQGACEREEFQKAVQALADAGRRKPDPQWTSKLQARSLDLKARIDAAYKAVRAEALEARRRGSEEEVRRLTARVARWGLNAEREDLNKALAASLPSTPSALQLYRACWSESIAAVRYRDFKSASRRIEGAKAVVTDTAVLAEAAADLEALRLAEAACEEAHQVVAKLPRGQKVSVAYFDAAGRRAEAEGTVVRADPRLLQLTRDAGDLVIPVGEITAGTLVQIVRARRLKSAKADESGPAYLCLLEGDAQGAKAAGAEALSIPEKYWIWAAQPAASPREAEARELFYAAERDFPHPTKTAEAVLKFRTLSKDYADTAFAGRNRALIASRGEGGREYFLIFEDLQAGGAFRPSKGEKDDYFWVSDKDSEASRIRETFVEVAFSVLPDVEYRCWVYAGGCCGEALVFGYQASELIAPDPRTKEPVPMEPGAETAAPVKPLSSQLRTHAAHLGRRTANRWGWVPIPLPRFATPGLKKVRIVTDRAGTTVSLALVSATRSAPPLPIEAKELERARLEACGLGPHRGDPTLVGHWRLADGAGSVAADASRSGKPGKFLGAPTWMPAGEGHPPSLAFNGKKDGVTLGRQLTLLKNVRACTLAAWIRPDSLGAGDVQNTIITFSKYNAGESRATIFLVDSGNVTVGGRSADSDPFVSVVTTGRPVKSGAWVHVAGVIDYQANAIAVYLNGVRQPTKGTPNFSARSTADTPSTVVAIGTDDNLTRNFFDGRIRDIRVYARALPAEEIASLASLPTSR